MNFGQLKKLDYNDNMPIEQVLEDLMFKGDLDYVVLSMMYTQALEKKKNIADARFIESATCNNILLSKRNPSIEDKKRALHIGMQCKNMNWDELKTKLNYTPQDNYDLAQLCETLYGQWIEQ